MNLRLVVSRCHCCDILFAPRRTDERFCQTCSAWIEAGAAIHRAAQAFISQRSST